MFGNTVMKCKCTVVRLRHGRLTRKTALVAMAMWESDGLEMVKWQVQTSPLSRAMDGCIIRHGTTSSCQSCSSPPHFQDCKALLFTSLLMTTASTHIFTKLPITNYNRCYSFLSVSYIVMLHIQFFYFASFSMQSGYQTQSATGQL